MEPFTVLDVPSLSFQLFNKTIDQNSRVKTMRAKKIKIHRVNEGVMHFDGDPLMAGKELEVEIIPGGLRVIASEKKKEKPENPKSTKASMGVYIFNWKILRQALKDDEKDKESSNDFGKNIIPTKTNKKNIN